MTVMQISIQALLKSAAMALMRIVTAVMGSVQGRLILMALMTAWKLEIILLLIPRIFLCKPG